MRSWILVVVLTLVGCKKHADAPATGSAGSAAGSGSTVTLPPPTPVPDAAAIDAAAPPPAGKLGSDVMDKETIGGIALGDDADKVTAALGKPTKKGKVEQEEATGDTVQTWSYGASFVMMSKREGRWGATAIRVDPPTDWKTSRGIHLGSTTAEVQAAYEGELSDDGFLVGSTYGGELFSIKDGKVTEIFLGAMAE